MMVAGLQRRVGMLLGRDIATGAPHAQPIAVLNRSDQIIENATLASVAAALAGFRVGESIALADELAEEFDVARLVARHDIAEARANDGLRRWKAIHPRHGIVALGQIA